MDACTTLTSLAMLKVNADRAGKDYIEYLKPFVEYVLATHATHTVTAARTKQLLIDEFGLRVTVQACELVLRRMAKRKQLRKEHNTFYRIAEITSKDIASKRADARTKLEQLISHFRQFVLRKFDRIWTAERAEGVFFEYLSKLAIECLRTYSTGVALPSGVHFEREEQFITNAFMNDLKTELPEMFDTAIIFVKGHMLSNALVCPDLDSIKDKFSDVVFYLDTPLILNRLGLQGAPQQAATEEMMQLVRNLKGKFAIFEHTAEEVNRVLYGCEIRLNDPDAKGRIIQEMRRRGNTASDLALIRAGLDDFYSSINIIRQDNPPYEAQFQIDERHLESAIEEEIRYLNPRAIEYDVNSIRSIYALRRGKEPTRLEKASAVLVTSNAKLAQVAYHYGQNMESSREVSTVIADFSLANVAWLKAPMEAPDLPRLELVAVCYAAMEPDDDLWSRYLREIDKLRQLGNVSPDMHAILRGSLKARDELMNLTLGSEEDFSERTVAEIIDRVKADMVAGKNKELQDQQAQLASARAAVQEVASQRDAQMAHIARIASQVGGVAGRAALVLTALLLVAGSTLGAMGVNSIAGAPQWFRFAVWVVFILLIGWSVVNWTTGQTLRGIASRIEDTVRDRVVALLSPRAGDRG